MNDRYVTRAEWLEYCRRIREEHWAKMAGHHRQASRQYQRKMKRLAQPPPKPKPRPAEDGPLDIESNSYADWLYNQGGGVMQTEIARGQEIHEDLTFWDDD